jgi:membrane-associated progesterone receptor component
MLSFIYLLVFLSILLFFIIKNLWKRKVIGETDLKLFSLNELIQYNGKNNKKIYIALKNMVFDVTSSPSYQPGQSYHILAGRDGSINLAKMSLEEEYLDKFNNINLNKEESKVLDEWVDYFKNKKYPVVGFLKKYQ